MAIQLLSIFLLPFLGSVGAEFNPISLTIHAERNPNYAPNGPAEYVRALHKWQIDTPQGLLAVSKQCE